jgi:hypothetical protein
MFGYIYKTTNLINGKLYIGKKKGKFTSVYLGSGVFIKQAIKKYNKINFTVEVLRWANTIVELNRLEEIYISIFRTKYGANKLYNIANGGGSTDKTKWMFYPDTLKKKCVRFEDIEGYIQQGWVIGANRRGKNNPMYGKGYLVSGDKNSSRRAAGPHHWSRIDSKVFICPICNKQLIVRNTDNRVCCSLDCRKKYNKIFKTCWIYNNTTNVIIKILESEFNKYKDLGYIQGRGEQFKNKCRESKFGYKNPMYVQREVRVCLYCKQSYSTKITSTQKYCSESCYHFGSTPWNKGKKIAC